ncbi:MAG: NAD(P)H-dependent oxidoreductase subunit E [Candidatus Bathyarchaeota archaeon]|nr:NAD(P)H-dependent oxidoreductase subunit E [Candidatus Bathyarchaeota archaeon]
MSKEDNRRMLLEKALKEYDYHPSALLEVLHKAQSIYGYLSKDLLMDIAQSLHLPPSTVFGVATFYSFFNLTKPGEHIVTGCLGTACYVKGSEQIMQAIEREFNVKRGGTTPDGKLSLFVTRCIGACAISPAIIIDDEVVGKATKEVVIERIKQLIGGPKQ